MREGEGACGAEVARVIFRAAGKTGASQVRTRLALVFRKPHEFARTLPPLTAPPPKAALEAVKFVESSTAFWAANTAPPNCN